MKTNNTRWLDPVLDLVQKHAPNTYEAMLNAHWPVTIVQSREDLIPISQQITSQDLNGLVHNLNNALGCTIERTDESGLPVYWGPAALEHTTWMNHHNLIRDALGTGVDRVRLAATVLVHEWTHRRGYGEKKAYEVGAKFARAMGDERIARMQEQTGQRVAVEKQQQEEVIDMLRRFRLIPA